MKSLISGINPIYLKRALEDGLSIIVDVIKSNSV